MGEDDRYHPVVLHNASHLAECPLKPKFELIMRDILRRLPVSPALDNLLLFRRQWRAENAQPSKWTKTPDQIIDRICRYCSRISESEH